MSDREFAKPSPVRVYAQAQATRNDGRIELQRIPTEFSFEEFLGAHVWTYEKWCEDGWDDAMVRIADAVEGAMPGQMVQLSAEDWDKLREATKATKLQGEFAGKLQKMRRAIRGAARVQDNGVTAEQKTRTG